MALISQNKLTPTAPLNHFILTPAKDCKTSIPLNLTKITSCTYLNAPNGGGIQELSSHDKDGQVFESEHNTTWYALTSKFDGELVFDITPVDSTNDYDFVLFPYKDSSFCAGLNNIKPLRSNLMIQLFDYYFYNRIIATNLNKVKSFF